eukprot:Rmarinus@m.27241
MTGGHRVDTQNRPNRRGTWTGFGELEQPIPPKKRPTWTQGRLADGTLPLDEAGRPTDFLVPLSKDDAVRWWLDTSTSTAAETTQLLSPATSPSRSKPSLVPSAVTAAASTATSGGFPTGALPGTAKADAHTPDAVPCGNGNAVNHIIGNGNGVGAHDEEFSDNDSFGDGVSTRVARARNAESCPSSTGRSNPDVRREEAALGSSALGGLNSSGRGDADERVWVGEEALYPGYVRLGPDVLHGPLMKYDQVLGIMFVEKYFVVREGWLCWYEMPSEPIPDSALCVLEPSARLSSPSPQQSRRPSARRMSGSSANGRSHDHDDVRPELRGSRGVMPPAGARSSVPHTRGDEIKQASQPSLSPTGHVAIANGDGTDSRFGLGGWLGVLEPDGALCLRELAGVIPADDDETDYDLQGMQGCVPVSTIASEMLVVLGGDRLDEVELVLAASSKAQRDWWVDLLQQAIQRAQQAFLSTPWDFISASALLHKMRDVPEIVIRSTVCQRDRTFPFSRHVYYLVSVPALNWTTHRRYTDFVALHQQLQAVWPECDNDVSPDDRATPVGLLPPLPPKAIFGNLDGHFIAERCGQLQRYLATVCERTYALDPVVPSDLSHAAAVARTFLEPLSFTLQI